MHFLRFNFDALFTHLILLELSIDFHTQYLSHTLFLKSFQFMFIHLKKLMHCKENFSIVKEVSTRKNRYEMIALLRDFL